MKALSMAYAYSSQSFQMRYFCKQLKILNFFLMPEVNERKVYTVQQYRDKQKLSTVYSCKRNKNYKTNTGKQKRKPLPSVQTDVLYYCTNNNGKKGL
jgi:hypothetical protein